MRHIATLASLVLAVVHCSPAQARPPVDEIFLSAADNVVTLRGDSSDGNTRTYRLRAVGNQAITFKIQADNAACGSEINKTTKLGLLTAINRFPASFTDAGKLGDDYTVSFFQNRDARINKVTCNFSFSVNP